MDRAPFFILNVFLNSFLAFITAAFLIEAVIFLFRIKQGRVAALLRMIPLLKLPLDLYLYDFSRWSYLQGINPLTCEEGTRTLSVLVGLTSSPSDRLSLPIYSKIQFSIPGSKTFTLADVIGYMINPSHLNFFSASLLFLCIGFFIRKLVIYRRCVKALNSIEINSEPATKKISNPHLIALIKKGKYSISASSILNGSPFVAGILSPTIYIPSHLLAYLSTKEYEAVLAHEIEHIRNRDVFIRFILDIITSLFWWVPTKWLQNRIEEGQEISCDDKCRKYGVDSVDLASAIYKSAKHVENHPPYIFAHRLTQHRTLKRIKRLTQPLPSRFQKIHFLSACLATSLAFLVILFGRFWIF